MRCRTPSFIGDNFRFISEARKQVDSRVAATERQPGHYSDLAFLTAGWE